MQQSVMPLLQTGLRLLTLQLGVEPAGHKIPDEQTPAPDEELEELEEELDEDVVEVVQIIAWKPLPVPPLL